MMDEIENSLRDINQKLKEKNQIRKPKNKIVFRLWTKEFGKNVFHSEATTLNFFNDKRAKNLCPYCDEIYHGKDQIKEDDNSWTFKCSGCKSVLIVEKD